MDVVMTQALSPKELKEWLEDFDSIATDSPNLQTGLMAQVVLQLATLRQEMAEQWRWVRENHEREQTAAAEIRSRVATSFEQFARGNLEGVLPFAYPEVGAADALRDGRKVADGIPRDAAGNEIKLD